MKKLLGILAIATAGLFTACSGTGEPERDPVKDSLTQQTQELSGQVSEKEAAIDSFLRAFNDIQVNLDEIKKKEKIINESTATGDVKSREEQIKTDIQAIYDLMAQNKARLAAAKKKLKDKDAKIGELQRSIELLESQLATREQEIIALKDQIEKLNIELGNMSMEVAMVNAESDAKTAKLNTAYYAYGTKKDLIANGVLTKEGGVIGLGKTTKLSSTMNTKYFEQVDITKTTEIMLNVKKAKVVSTHPSDSYSIVEADGKAEKLVISDADKFWSVSKYLVIVVD
ncbi:MAG: hypothetical protein ACRCYO_06420 [Bacteroidia bacterium]